MNFEQNVPIPASCHGKYPFADLKPGESVLYPCTDSKDRHRARKAAYRTGEYHSWELTVRSLPEGVRVWRIA